MLDENNCQIVKYFDFPLRIERKEIIFL